MGIVFLGQQSHFTTLWIGRLSYFPCGTRYNDEVAAVGVVFFSRYGGTSLVRPMYQPYRQNIRLLTAPSTTRTHTCYSHSLQPARGSSGNQDLSEFLTKRTCAESGSPPSLPWLGGQGGKASSAPCIPDDDLKLEWIHGYSAQVSSGMYTRYLVLGVKIMYINKRERASIPIKAIMALITYINERERASILIKATIAVSYESLLMASVFSGSGAMPIPGRGYDAMVRQGGNIYIF